MTGIGERYECAVCHGVFTKTWSDEEALAEAFSLFPADDIATENDRGIVCDDCFRKVMACARANTPGHLLQPGA